MPLHIDRFGRMCRGGGRVEVRRISTEPLTGGATLVLTRPLSKRVQTTAATQGTSLPLKDATPSLNLQHVETPKKWIVSPVPPRQPKHFRPLSYATDIPHFPVRP